MGTRKKTVCILSILQTFAETVVIDLKNEIFILFFWSVWEVASVEKQA